MERANKEAVWEIWEKGQSDPQYRMMLMEIRAMEKAYDAVLKNLPEEQRNTVCDYVSLCEAMSWRMLEIACQQKKTPGA